MSITHNRRVEVPSEVLRRGAATTALYLTGVLHLLALPSHLRDAPYVALTMAVVVPLCFVIGSWLWTSGEGAAWATAAVLVGALVVAFLISRTIGLPTFQRAGMAHYWTEGLPALAAELGVLGLASEQWSSLPPKLTNRPINR